MLSGLVSESILVRKTRLRRSPIFVPGIGPGAGALGRGNHRCPAQQETAVPGPTVAVISGGNVDPDLLKRLVAE